jgi:gliding motility-associated-like protein
MTGPTTTSLSVLTAWAQATSTPFTTINTGSVADTGMVTVTPSLMGCVGDTTTFLYVVNPAAINAVQDQMVCNGAMTNDVQFSGGDAGATYSWTNDNTSIGLPASGNGDINAFNAINNGTQSDTATIIAYSSFIGCNSDSTIFLIIVNPIPVIDAVNDQTLCGNQQTAAVDFNSNVAGTTYSWTNDNTTIGLPSNGNGTINPFTTVNNGTENDTANVTVTPSFMGCNGASTTFSIIVEPSGLMDAVNDQTLCNEEMTADVIFSGGEPGTVYNWTNDNANIGLGDMGTGNIDAFTAINTGTEADTATIIVTPSPLGCGGMPQTFLIIINPTPAIAFVPDQTVCNGAMTSDVVFIGTVDNPGFSWINDNTAIGLPASGTGDIAAFMASNTTAMPDTAVITVTPTANGCTGLSNTFMIIVSPTPTVNGVADQIVCNNGMTDAVNFSGATTGTNYNWTNDNVSVGLAASGTGNIPAFTATNTGLLPEIANITVTPSADGCDGATESFSIMVLPGSAINSVADQTVCNGETTTAVVFSGGLPGTTFSWTNDNTTTGLPGSGNGNIGPFTATNTGTTPQTSNITVTPFGSGCDAITTSFNITVNPTPNVNPVVDQTHCNGQATNAVNFSGDVAGTTYSWTNTNPSIGLAANGNNNIPSFTAINTGSTAQTATITVTPTANGCSGATTTFAITVNPGSAVNSVADQTLCNGASTTAVTFTGSGIGTTYNWTNSNPSIGLPASGSGNIGSFNVINNGTTAQTATITVSPLGSGCSGTTTSFTITVNPTPSVNGVADQTLCGNATTTNVVMSGGVGGATYTWTNSNPSIGLPASGSGTIAPFAVINNGTTPQTATITVTPTANGCTGSTTSFTITVNAIPTANATTNAPVCEGGSFTLNAETVVGGTYSWTGPDGFTSQDQDNTVTNATLANAGTYFLVVVTDGCASAASTVDVVVNVCATPADLSVVKTVDNTNPTVGQQVVFTIVATNNGTSDATGVAVEEILQSGYTYVTSATSAGTYNTATGIWTIGTLNNGDSESMTITVTVNASGTYTNTASISGNEADGNMANNAAVIETFPTDFFIPEGFSPNGDGVNDVFVIRGLDSYPNNAIVIFNRWGNSIFEESPYLNAWDGKSTAGLSLGSDDLPMGTYFYLLDLGNGSDVLKGTIFISK